MHNRKSDCSPFPGFPVTHLALAARELDRYINVPPDSLSLSLSDMEERVERLAQDRNLPWLNMAWMKEKNREDCEPFFRFRGERVVTVGGRTGFRLPRNISAESFDVHYTWRDSVGVSVKDDTLPFGGQNDCAVDVCLVMGRLMKVGLNNCDQRPLTDKAALPRVSTFYRAVIARPWHRLDRSSLNANRTKLADMIREDAPGDHPTGEVGERRFLFFDEALDPLMEGVGSGSFTMMAGSYCPKCQVALMDPARPLIRYTSLSADANIQERLKSPNATQAGLGPFVNQILGPHSTARAEQTHTPCKTVLSTVDVVIDRLPPFLLLKYGWHQCTHESLLADMTVEAYHALTGKEPVKKAVKYSWVGLVVHVCGNHFVLYWRIEIDEVLAYDGLKANPRYISIAQMRSELRKGRGDANSIIYKANLPPQLGPQPP